MDRTYIQSQHIVERYLSGDLSVREAREFEKYCLDHPEVLNALPIPVRVKTRLAKRPGEVAGSDDDFSATTITQIDLDDDDDVPSPSGFRGFAVDTHKWTVILGVALLVAVVGGGYLWFKNGQLEDKLKAAQRTVKAVSLRPPGTTRDYHVQMSPTRPEAPAFSVGTPETAEMIELFVDVSKGRYNLFLVTIENVTEGRAMQIRRIARDTNGELRIGINSSAFTPGDYDLKLEGYTWRGDTYPVGWVRIGMK